MSNLRWRFLKLKLKKALLRAMEPVIHLGKTIRQLIIIKIMEMKRFGFYIMLCSLLALASCEQDEMGTSKISGEGFTLIGNSSIGTKTSFGTPESGKIPFLWKAGDCIYVNGVNSEPLQEGGTTAEFIFTEGSVKAGDAVYFGGVDLEKEPGKCMVLACPWQDGDSKDLSYNCEFGYAIVGADNSFVLEHYSSYLWLNTYSQEVTKKVAKVTITAQNDIVGWYEFDEDTRKFVGPVSSMIPAEEVTGPDEEILAQTKSIVMEFQDKENNYTPTPKQLLAASSDEEIWAVAVTLPVTTGTLRIDYEFEDGTCASYNYPSKTLAAGTTYRITQEIKAADLYQLRTLTFEDADAKFAHYYLDNGTQITKWSDLIDDAQYGGTITYNQEGIAYTWSDNNNTGLQHSFTTPYWGGGHVISNYVNDNYTTLPDGKYGWYELQMEIPVPAHSGSNFAVHNGYSDFFNSQLYDASLQCLTFPDGEEHIIDHIYVMNTNYVLNSLTYGDGFNSPATEGTYVKIMVYGYNSNDELTGSSEFSLCKGTDLIGNWTKWDLSALGKVAKISFNFSASEDQSGSYGLNCPAYFAYDDVAVRFSVNE